MVEPYWLAELGPMFFSVRESGSDLHTRQRQEQEDQRQMEYQQKLRDDLERQAKQEEAAALARGGGRVTEVGVTRPKRQPRDGVAVPANAAGGDEGDDSDSDGAAAKRRRRAGNVGHTASSGGDASSGGGGGPRIGSRGGGHGGAGGRAKWTLLLDADVGGGP